MRLSLLATSLILASSCAPTQVIPSPPPGPVASSAPPVDSAPALVTAAPEPDPSIVRCGIDDRPRSVTSSADHGTSERNAKRAMEPVPIMPMPRRPPAQGTTAPSGPFVPRVTVSVGPARATSGQLAPGISDSLARPPLPFTDCDGLASVDDEGTLELRVALATGGAPLTVASTTPPSKSLFARCVLERTCQLRAAADAAAAEVILPMNVKWNFPRVKATTPQTQGGTAPFVAFEGISQEATAHPFFTFVRTMTRQAARSCNGGRVSGSGARARVVLHLAGRPGAPKIEKLDTEAVGPGVDSQLLTCLAEAIKAEGLIAAPASFTSRELSVIIDFD